MDRLRNSDFKGNSRPRGPQRIADVIAQLMARRGYGQQMLAEERTELWRQVVGERLAKQTRAGGISRGTLEITVKNSVVMQELTFRKRQLVDQLVTLAPEQKIKDIRFRVGAVD